MMMKMIASIVEALRSRIAESKTSSIPEIVNISSVFLFILILPIAKTLLMIPLLLISYQYEFIIKIWLSFH